MKLVTYRDGGALRVGVQLADGVHDAGFDADMVALIERWGELRDSVARHAESSPALPAAVLEAPLRPRSLRDFLTFEGHLKNSMTNLGRPIAPEWYTTPAYYKGMPDTVIGPEHEIPWPAYTEKLDHELELEPSPSDEQIAEGLGGNLCRCGSYVKIVEAVRRCAAEGD